MKPNGDTNHFTRALVIGARLASGGEVTSQYLRERFGVSPATAKRDMVLIERTLAPDVQVAPNNRRILRLPARW